MNGDAGSCTARSRYARAILLTGLFPFFLTTPSLAQDSIRCLPGYTCINLGGLRPNAINNVGQIVGVAGGVGFLRNPDGSVTPIDFPGATSVEATGINDAGQVVGFIRGGCVQFPGDPFCARSFRLPGGPFDPCTQCSAFAHGINNAGQIVGLADLFFVDTTHFFRFPGGFFSIDFPGAIGPGSCGACGINDAGQIAGTVGVLPSGFNRGFLLSGGVTIPINLPGAFQTNVHGINNSGEIVGFGGGRGFVVRPPYTIDDFTIFSIPDTEIEPNGINDSGQIVGFFRNPGGSFLHGFLATPLTTRLVVIDPGHGQILQNGVATYQRPPSPTYSLVEDVLTLDISKSLETKLRVASIAVLLTRQTALAPFAPPNCPVPCFADINKRVRWAEKQEPDLMVSIHTNAGAPSANGAESYYSTLSPTEDSAALAQAVLQRVVELGLRNRGVKQSNFNIINSTMPSTLIEIAFHSNSELAAGQTITDETRLNDPLFRSSAANAISDAIGDYYATK